MDRRIHWANIIITAGMLMGMALSWPLWLSTDRYYALVPILPSLLPVALVLNNAVLAVCVVSLAARFFSTNKIWSILFAGSFALLLVFDQSRWQPWVQVYGIALLVLSFPQRGSGDRFRIIHHTLCFMLIALYFWSGLQKVNMGFFAGVFPWLLGPFVSGLPEQARLSFYTVGLFVPFLEMGMAGLLAFPKTRQAGVVLVSAMHLFILASISPLGHNWNYVVWPWNVVMAALVMLLFWRTGTQPKDMLVNDKGYAHGAVVAVFGILPLLSFFGAWDSYLSFTLYSGNNNEAVIRFPSAEAVPSRLAPYTKNTENGGKSVNLLDWSIGDLHVPRYPEARVMKAVFKAFCSGARAAQPELVISGKQYLWIGPQAEQRYRCEDMR